MIELSPAGAAREREVPCAWPGCRAMTPNFSRLCSFHIPDPHEVAALRDERLAERYERG